MIVEDLQKLQELYRKGKTKGETIKCWESLARALYFYKDDKKRDSNKKQFFRIAKKYSLPIYRESGRIYMFKEDIETINQFYLLGLREIAAYIGIHIKTLRKWLKRYPKMPVNGKKEVAFKPALDLWYATLILDREKRGEPTRHLVRYGAPIVDRLGSILYALDRLGFSHPKALKPYWLHPENDILKIITRD
jgi:hypothetical protein